MGTAWPLGDDPLVTHRAERAAPTPVPARHSSPTTTARVPAPREAGRPSPGRVRAPGWPRALLGTLLGGALGFGLVVALRAISGLDIFQTEPTGYPHLIVPAITAPLGFLAGIGCFDYWLRWAIGSPTRPEDHSDHGADSWRDYLRFNTDHKVIGVQYIVTTFVFFFIGGALAMGIRAELAQPGTQLVDAHAYNGLFSTHAAIMIFLFVIPVFAGIANYVLPLMIGAPDMAFPRLNAFSFWLLPFAGVLFLTSFLVPGGAFDAGWTGYAPLSTGAPLGQSFFNLGVQFAGWSSILAALNFLATIISMRAPGMNFWRMPLLVWANLATSILIVGATPFIAAVQFMVLFDRTLDTHFFEATTGGDVLSYQHIFWFYSHPAVYIMMLPGFGIVSEVISTNARKPVFGYRLMALSLIGIVILSYSVWAHHMFVSGMFSWLRVPMMLTSALIAIPTGIKIFSWLATLFKGVIHTESAGMLFALGFVCSFILGGISGVMTAMVPIDIHVTDTYFIVAHIHFVLFAGSVFTIFAGIYHWFPKITGRMFDPKLGRLHFWLTLAGTWGTFLPMHWIGMEGMPRRVADYSAQFGDWNLVISLFGFMLGAAQLVFLFNMIVSWRWGPRASPNPWRAKTIEWQVSSPPPRFNFEGLPRVVGGPYEFGVPGAHHALMPGDDGYNAPRPAPAREKREPSHA
jgi:cytochrome c oxidase subunit 1